MPVSLYQSLRGLLLAIIMLSLVKGSTQFPITDNTTEICPAPYMQFKRPDPFYMPRLSKLEELEYNQIIMLEKECPKLSDARQWASAIGLIISTVANFSPWKTAKDISRISANNILIQGMSCLFFSEMNLSLFFYRCADKCLGTWIHWLTIFVAIWNAIYFAIFWKHTNLDTKQTLLVLLAYVIIGTICYAFSGAAGAIFLICLLFGHFFRVMFMLNARKCHWFTCTMSGFGLMGSACCLYGAGDDPMSIPKVSFGISFAVRMVDIALQVFVCCRNEQCEIEGGVHENLLAEGNGQRRELADADSVEDNGLNESDNESSEPSLDHGSSSPGHSSGSTSNSSTKSAPEELETRLEQAIKDGRTDVTSKLPTDRELDPPVLLTMSIDELKVGLTSAEKTSQPDKSRQLQMIDTRCERCNEKKVGISDIIHGGHGDCYQLECTSCGDKWFSSKDAITMLMEDTPSTAGNVGTAPWAMAKFDVLEKKLATPRDQPDKPAADALQKSTAAYMPTLEKQKSFVKPKTEGPSPVPKQE